MKDSHITVRLPAPLARALSRYAKDADLARSQVVREAVSRYLTASPSGPGPRPTVTAAELATRWPTLPRLSPDEADLLSADLAAARDRLPPAPPPAWE